MNSQDLLKLSEMFVFDVTDFKDRSCSFCTTDKASYFVLGAVNSTVERPICMSCFWKNVPSFFGCKLLFNDIECFVCLQKPTIFGFLLSSTWYAYNRGFCLDCFKKVTSEDWDLICSMAILQES